MNNRPITYIFSFLFLFVILVGIQVYSLINNYTLKEKEIIELVRSKLSNLEDDRDIFDDNYLKNERYINAFVAFDEHKITEDSLRNLYQIHSQKTSPELRVYLDSLFADLGYHVTVKKELTAIKSNSTNRQLLNNKITIYESQQNEGQNNYLSSGSWELNFTKSVKETENVGELSKVNSNTIQYDYMVSRNSTFSISNLQWLVFKELYLFVLASFLLLIAILYIFYRTYKNLQQQQKQILILHDMVDNVSHELRTPISTIKLASKNLQKKHQDSNFVVLDRQIKRLEKLLEPLSKPVTTENKSEYHISELNQLLADLLLNGPQVNLNLTSFPVKPFKIQKDSFETILSNLISNSLKYGASEVNLSLELQTDLLKLKIHDNGHGIDQSELAFIFDKFYRVQKNNVHANNGFGLGLYIVKQLVDKLKGKIKVTSELNKGTEFLITLPNGG